MKKLLEKYKWYAPPSIFLLMALYDWLILAEHDPNKFYGSFILFIIVFFIPKERIKRMLLIQTITLNNPLSRNCYDSQANYLR